MENPATKTALGPMIVVAADQHEPAPLVHDPWAARLLPATGRFVAALTRWSPVTNSIEVGDGPENPRRLGELPVSQTLHR